jgi:hypothetical protein
MKSAPRERRADADGSKVQPNSGAPCITFRVTKFSRCDFGSKKARLSIEIPGVGTLDIDFFRPPNREPFVAPASTRSKFDGKWTRHFRLDERLADEVLAAVVERLVGESEDLG